MGNLRETEISMAPLVNYGKCVRFPKIFPSKKCGEISSCFAVNLKSRERGTMQSKNTVSRLLF